MTMILCSLSSVSLEVEYKLGHMGWQKIWMTFQGLKNTDQFSDARPNERFV